MESQVMKQLLTEAGIIGGIVNDFDPQFQLDVIYGDKRICLGDQVSPAQVHHKPSRFEYFHDPAHPEVLETFRDPTFLTLVMTDPDAPGGEYLHWLCRHFTAVPQERDMTWQELLTYEATTARHMGTRKIVFTAFKPKEALPNANIGMVMPNIIMPESRNNFSTRDFASTNSLGAPVAAAFFKIIDPVDAGNHCDQELPASNGHVR